MRIAIREQLALLVLLTVLLALAVVSIPTWLYVNGHIANNLRQGLALTASLKASRITAELELVQTSCYTISSRLLIQQALTRFYTTGVADWAEAGRDIISALSVGATSWLLQARIYSRNTTGPVGGVLFNVTSDTIDNVDLPYNLPDGRQATLSDTEDGYPTMLYPNITYVDLGRPNHIRPNTSAIAAEAFPDVWISQDGGLLLGPLVVNEKMALISVSIPIRDNGDNFILGYMTIIALADPVFEVRDSPEGLDESGTTLILGPTTPWNRFEDPLTASNATFTPDRHAFGELDVQFVIPPSSSPSSADRHTKHQFSDGSANLPFPVKDYPAALDAFADQTPTINNASAMLKTHNEQNVPVSVGFARTQTPLVNWTIIVEKSQHEAYKPINTLSTILLGTVFGTAGVIAVLVFPCAHLGVMPIRKLKSATEKSVNPPGYEDSFLDFDDDDEDSPRSGGTSHKSKKGVMSAIRRFLNGQTSKPSSTRDATRRMFKIPGKVNEGKHFITDELTELTRTFNDMSDELVKQYMSLDEKVAERTRQLSESKKAAEAANESKTLFIANISHELKTPLNGILGMCAVCMEENDINRIKQSLNTVYKSGDLLLHLLEDLLSFSKNQIGAQLKMEMKEFRFVDIRQQILTIFEKQVREGRIDFSVNFVGSSGVIDLNPNPNSNVASSSESCLPPPWPRGSNNLNNMRLWGDQHRILQVIINLVSNSLKFTPPKGSVQVRITCLGEDENADDDLSRTSSMSKSISKTSRVGRSRYRGSSNSNQSATQSMAGSVSQIQGGTALLINPMDPKATPHIQVRERSPTPPPPGAKTYTFQFEVQDTGPGIPESMQQKVFEPFVQGDLGLSKKFGGTGLGLSICHQLAGLMGGTLSLQSEQGRGTTFTMQIPLKYAEHRSSSAASSLTRFQVAAVPGPEATENDSQRNSLVITTTAAIPAPDSSAAAQSLHSTNPNPRLVGLSQPYFSVEMPEKTAEVNVAGVMDKDSLAKPRVLVADDNSTNIEVVSRMLKLEEIYDVTIAKDGQEAYDVVKASMEKNEAFDVIFMDVQMPNVDGLQSTRLIRGMGYKSPIVALTAFSEESNVKECMDSGMNEFLSKPIRRPQLKQVLQRFATIPEESEAPNLTSTRISTDRRKAEAWPRPKSESRPNGDVVVASVPVPVSVPVVATGNGTPPGPSPAPSGADVTGSISTIKAG